MTDTTTITPEERRMFAEDAKYVLARSMDIEFKAAAEAILRLLTALEAAEARAEKAEAESARLRAERDWLASALAEDGCPYLAFWAVLYEDMRPDWCICTDTADDGFDCTGDPKECWQQEAARRAVAAAKKGE